MSDLCFEDRVASWSTFGLVEERNNVLTIYTHPLARLVNREMQGIQVGLWRVLTEWYTQESFLKRMVRNESFDAL